jgi:xylulose-5-phosphate/fructose-6-phosphate phosphoketolase
MVKKQLSPQEVKKIDAYWRAVNDLSVLNDLDRYNLLIDVLERVPGLVNRCAYIRDMAEGKLIEHKRYIQKRGQDMPEILNWKWPY